MAGRYRDNCPLDCKVYVGELGNNGSRAELEEAFGYYGPLKNVWVARNPPGFAFVMFEDPRDAKDACRALNGKTICGRKVRVELSSGKTRREMAQGDGRGRGEPYGRDYDRGRSPPPRGGDRYYDRGGSPPPRGRSPPPRRDYGHHPPARGAPPFDDGYYGRGRSPPGRAPTRRAPRSRSRSRSISPVPRGARDGHGNGNKSRTPISRSRSRSISKSPEPRYR